MAKIDPNFNYTVDGQPFQSEGGRSLGGRSASIWDEFTKRRYCIPPSNLPAREIDSIEVSADMYHKYRTDAKIMEKMKFTSFRSAIDWTRIFPKDENYVNPEGIKFYDDFFKTLLRHNVKPVIILFQWDVPLWAEMRGGWTTRDILKWFRNYAKVIFRYFGKYTDTFFSSNESSNMIFEGYGNNFFPPERNDKNNIIKGIHYTNLAHAISKEELEIAKTKKYVNQEAKMGYIHDWEFAYPHDPKNTNDLEAVKMFNIFHRDLFLDPVFFGKYPAEIKAWCEHYNYDYDVTQDDLDYLKKFPADLFGWNCYRAASIAHTDNQIADSEKAYPDKKFFFSEFALYKYVYPKKWNYTKWGWPVVPECWTDGAIAIDKKYKVPIFITENGYGDFDEVNPDGTVYDFDRIAYLQNVFKAIAKAYEKGVKVIGLGIWSYCDLFSPSGGYRKQYGLIRVDMHSPIRERFPKASALYIRQVANSNGTNLDYDEEQLKKDLKKEMKTWDLWYR